MLRLKAIRDAVKPVINQDTEGVGMFAAASLNQVEKYSLGSMDGTRKLYLVDVRPRSEKHTAHPSDWSVLVFSTKQQLSILDTDGKDDATFAVVLDEKQGELELLRLDTVDDGTAIFYRTNIKQAFRV